MRPKSIAALMGLSGLLLAAVLWPKNRLETPSPVPPAEEVAAQSLQWTPSSTAVETIPSTPDITSKLTAEEARAAVEAQVERLTQLSQENDPTSLPEILFSLTHADKEVREAALEATIQVGDSNAIPVLKAAADLVSDFEEKIAFLEAMEFLSVPQLTFDGDSVPRTPQQIVAAEQRRALRHAERDRETAANLTRPARPSFGAVAPASAAQQ